MYVANCSLKYNPENFTVVNRVLTLAGNTELVGDPFIAHHCGGLLLDGGVFAEKKVDGKYVVCLVAETPTSYIKAKCSLLVDGDAFEIVDGALSLKAVEPSGFDIRWDGDIEGKEVALDTFYKVSDVPLTVEELTGAIGYIIIDNTEFSAEIVPADYSDSGLIIIQDETVDEGSTYQFGLSVLSDIYLEDVMVTKGLYLYRPAEDIYTSRLYKA